PICVIQEPDLKRLANAPAAVRHLTELFRPIPYPAKNSPHDERFRDSFRAELERRKALKSASTSVYSAISRYISTGQEIGAVPAYETLWNQATRILGEDIVRTGRLPVLYADESSNVGGQAMCAAIDMLWSAWLLIHDQSPEAPVSSGGKSRTAMKESV